MPLPAVIRHHPLATTLIAVVVIPLLLFALWVMISLHFSYASGERAGFLQKISQRGWLCKTWEGELQLTAIPGATPEIFDFTSRSDSIATELEKMAGDRVVLTYEQHKGVPGSCFGDTEYYVTGVRLVTTP